MPGSVARLLPYTIGGAEQWVLLRGVDVAQPHLLVVPDGPGESFIPVARSVHRELERAFVVANWDPRGTGLSFDRSAPSSRLTIDRLVEDTVELAERLAEEFHRERIALLGHGFGSVVGLLAAARAPKRFDCYLGFAQWVDPSEGERRSRAWARSEAERIGRPDLVRLLNDPDGRDPAMSRDRLNRALLRLGGVWHEPDRRPQNARPSPFEVEEYTLLDELVRAPRGRAVSAAALGPGALAIDLAARVSRLEVPTYFLSGRFDRLVDPELAREYLRVLDAPRKGWAWIEETAHQALFEDPDAYAAALAHFAHGALHPEGPRWSLAG